MKRPIYYALALFFAFAISACSHSHDAHEHSHEGHAHSHEAHEHSHEEHAHSHKVHEHSHDAHEHSHEGHAHSHESHEHSHEEHAHSQAAAAHDAAAPNILHFSKEQQKMIEFAIEKVKPSTFNGAVKVAARVEAAPGNVTTVVATNAGRVHYAGNIVEGKDVRAGEALFSLDGSNVTENDAAVKFAEAESKYRVAKADYERKASLYKDNVVSLKELQTAEAALKQAEAHYNSMQGNFSNGKMVLKAPMAGYIASLLVDNGAYVAAGTPLAQIQRSGEVNIVAELPVRFASALTNITGVNIELTDCTVCSLDEVEGRVLAVGRSANSCNMVPVTVAARRLDAVVPGSIVTLHLAMSLPEGETRLAVPRTALVEEMGNFFVFVHKGGDAFEKREVRIGATDGRYTQVLRGLHSGEAVVSKGAVSLKLSQGAAALDPHAGHVH